MTEVLNHIVKVGDKYRLLSHEGKNLGTFDTHAEAAKHEGDVEYFKEHKNATAAGVLYHTPDNQILLMKRKADRTNGGMWSLPAGHIENGESAEQAARREFNEETGFDIGRSACASIDADKGFAAFSVEGNKFEVKLNDEHDEYTWAHIHELPQPLHPGLDMILTRESERKNALFEPRTYYCRHMQPGICGYSNETILVDVDGMKKLIASAKDRGVPVYIHHNDDSYQTRMANLKEDACGFITDSFYNELDGWAWFKFLAVDDVAHNRIADGWRVSNAYVPSKWGAGGTKNNLPFDRELLDGTFTHLAIVPDPRYESACIMTPDQFRAYQESKRHEIEELRNSKEGTPPMKLFNLIRKEANPAEISNDTQVELQNAEGKTETVTVAEMIAAVAKQKAADAEKQNKKNDMDEMMCEVDGEKMSVKELANRFQKLNSERKNAEEEEAKKKKEKEEEEEKENAAKAKKNAEDAEKEKERKEDEESEKKNGKHFQELLNAASNAAAVQVSTVEVSTDGVARGKARYGS